MQGNYSNEWTDGYSSSDMEENFFGVQNMIYEEVESVKRQKTVL